MASSTSATTAQPAGRHGVDGRAVFVDDWCHTMGPSSASIPTIGEDRYYGVLTQTRPHRAGYVEVLPCGGTFGLDYDDTVTRDPALFRRFVELVEQAGWTVYVVTARHSGCRIPSPWHELAIYCGGRPKREVCEARGIHIDVWIDDTPESITQVDPQHAGPG